MKYVFGIDIGGTAVKLGLFDGGGGLMMKKEIPSDTSDSGARILKDTADALLGIMADKGLSAEDIAGIGAGVPGAVKDGRTVDSCVNLGWGPTDVASELSGLTGIENVVIDNDANCAAFGELKKGGGRGCRNMVFITLGTGVGAGIIIDGKIVRGAFGAAGEIGHITMSDEETEPCGCGKYGHLEQYASATGIVRTAERMLREKDAPSALREAEEITAGTVFEAAASGDSIALDAADFACRMLGKAMAVIACVADPEVFVIGGGVSNAGEQLLSPAGKYYRKYAFAASEYTPIVKARLGNDAGIYGAAALVLETV